MSDLAAALMVAIQVHADQYDQQGEPYLLHVLRVVKAVSDEAKIVAALHEVLEYGHASDISTGLFMLDDDEFQAVRLLTRRGDSYSDYVGRIRDGENRAHRLAREVKLADLRDNLGRIPAEPDSDHRPHLSRWRREWLPLKARYEKAIEVLAGSSGTAEDAT
jgi:hypothetical protein